MTPVSAAADVESPNHTRQSKLLEETQPLLQASSPDEVALVKFAWSMKMKLKERERTQCTLRNLAGVSENYRVVAMFPFTSESKKMSVLLR